jgi:hypothetical protein
MLVWQCVLKIPNKGKITAQITSIANGHFEALALIYVTLFVIEEIKSTITAIFQLNCHSMICNKTMCGHF